MTTFNKMQSVKRRFFAMRNGIVADTYRRASSPFRIVFGLNLPQISEIAADYGCDHELAATLWANTSTRESMLIAPMLMDAGNVDRATIDKMVDEVFDREVADVLVHRILRRRADAPTIADELAVSDRPLKRYIALRMAYALLDKDAAWAKKLADEEISRNDQITLTTARMLSADASFLLETEGE